MKKIIILSLSFYCMTLFASKKQPNKYSPAESVEKIFEAIYSRSLDKFQEVINDPKVDLNASLPFEWKDDSEVMDYCEGSPFHFLVSSHEYSILLLKIMLKAGVNCHRKTALVEYIDYYRDTGPSYFDRLDPIVLADRFDNLEAAAWLIVNGADIQKIQFLKNYIASAVLRLIFTEPLSPEQLENAKQIKKRLTPDAQLALDHLIADVLENPLEEEKDFYWQSEWKEYLKGMSKQV